MQQVAGHVRAGSLINAHKRKRVLRKMSHAHVRLRERTSVAPAVLTALEERLKRAKLPSGAAYVRIPGGHAAALKQVTPTRHVVATVLHRDMRPRGQDVTGHLTEERVFMEKHAALLGL